MVTSRRDIHLVLIDGELLLTFRTLNSPISVGHGNFLEPTLIFIVRINVGHVNCFSRRLTWVIILFCATIVSPQK